jgi:hypothetical protein
MMRPLALALSAAAMLLLPPAMPGAQAQQQKLRVELDQSLLEKWLLLMPQMTRLVQSGSMPQTEQEAQAVLERVCTKAGFDGYEQCTQVLGYVGMIASAWNPATRSFRDPLVQMRAQLASLEADTSPPTPERNRTIAEMKQILANLPEHIPQEHLQLVTANHDRVLAATGRQ